MELQRSGIPVIFPRIIGQAMKKENGGAAPHEPADAAIRCCHPAPADPVLAQAEEELLELQRSGLAVTLPR